MGCGSSSTQQKEQPKLNIIDSSRYKKQDELTFKVVLLGDVYVGKTTILSKLQQGENDSGNYFPTVGFAFSQQTIHLENNVDVTLQLWDTSGQDIYRDLMSIYYRDSHAAILVFDYSNPKTLQSLKYWLTELDDRINTNDIVIKIAGNKCDLIAQQEEKITEE